MKVKFLSFCTSKYTHTLKYSHAQSKTNIISQSKYKIMIAFDPEKNEMKM